MTRCKHNNCKIEETIEATHERYIDDSGDIQFNNTYGNGIRRIITCLDCGYEYKFNWKKKIPKWVIRERDKLNI